MCFGRAFLNLVRKNSCKNLKKNILFLLTTNIYLAQTNPNVHIIPHKYMGWPYDTLMRFEVFSSIEKELVGFDYIFFFNANMVINEVINEEEFLKVKAHDVNLIMVQHPGVYNKKTRYLPVLS